MNKSRRFRGAPRPRPSDLPPRWSVSLLSQPLLVLSTLLMLVHWKGAPVAISGISVSNFFILIFLLPEIVSGRLTTQFPKVFLLPILPILSILMLDIVDLNGGNLIWIFQSAMFLIFPYVVWRVGCVRKEIQLLFVFVLASQFYLTTIHGLSFPENDLGGFFVQRRTIHSLMLGYVSLLMIPLLRRESSRIVLFGSIAILLVVSQARGAALLFILSAFMFDSDVFRVRTKLAAALLSVVAAILIIRLDPEIIAHYDALLSLSGGSSSGYRAYLFESLVTQVDRYWLSGMPNDDIQNLLAEKFTDGRRYYEFPLDNSIVLVALRYGLLPLFLTLLLAARLLKSFKPTAVFFVGWLFLDDILGSGLGWFLLGLTIVVTKVEASRSNSRLELLPVLRTPS